LHELPAQSNFNPCGQRHKCMSYSKFFSRISLT
jgi:hypothetical protein